MASSVSNVQSQDFAFREIVRLLIDEFTGLQDYTVNGMPVWCSLILTRNDGVFALYIVEETVDNTSADYSFCDHSGLCKRKYHFIIPELENRNEPLEGNFAQFRSHYLYGLIHCNGHGHLICVNDSKDNSILVDASEAMEFWNDLCTLLKARKNSACDYLTEGSIELRLSFFGRWGYKLNGESSGITEQKYEWAIQFLSSLGLDSIVGDFSTRKNGNRIKQVIIKHRELSEKPLVTIIAEHGSDQELDAVLSWEGVLRDMHWPDGKEVEEIGNQIVSMIIDEMIDELIVEF